MTSLTIGRNSRNFARKGVHLLLKKMWPERKRFGILLGRPSLPEIRNLPASALECQY